MILVIDDDYSVTASLGLLLKQAGYRSRSAAGPEEALRHVDSPDVKLVFQDMNFSRRTTGEEGLELLSRIRSRRPDLPVVLMTAWGSIELAVEGIKAGARDFITKPWNDEQILHVTRTALGLAERESAAGPPLNREALEQRYDLGGIIGKSRAFLEAVGMAARVAATDASILITGESGTGKEVVAELVHRNSHRRDGPFVKVNLGGIPAPLFESEMFGHVKGAFTDAHRDREGRFARAAGGTILLDEIGELDPSCQVKMLRVLQDRTYEVLGTDRTRSLDVRVISATNRDLAAAVAAGTFREDLFYRINLIPVQIPSLADRREDVPLLAEHFCRRARETYSRPGLTITKEALEWLSNRAWPGNVRQVEHLVERAILVSEGAELAPADFACALPPEERGPGDDPLPPVGSMTIEEIERAMIRKSVEHHRGNLSRVAESLGLSRAALYRRLEKYGIRV
jgi:DNA-binding NtrC family response regulator